MGGSAAEGLGGELTDCFDGELPRVALGGGEAEDCSDKVSERQGASISRSARSLKCKSDRWRMARLSSRRMSQPAGDHQVVCGGRRRASGGCQTPKRSGDCSSLRANDGSSTGTEQTAVTPCFKSRSRSATCSTLRSARVLTGMPACAARRIAGSARGTIARGHNLVQATPDRPEPQSRGRTWHRGLSPLRQRAWDRRRPRSQELPPPSSK